MSIHKETARVATAMTSLTAAHPIYNFCAGPAALPKAVLEQARRELLDWQGLGVSVMEISHRSEEYQQLAHQAEQGFRQLLNIGESHAVLFLQGGATLQFSNIAMALLNTDNQAEYLCNGIWSQKAADEAARFGKAISLNVMQRDQDGNLSLVDLKDCERVKNPAYTHFTPNETIEGLRFSQLPATQGALVADLSSCILSEQINIDDYDLIYAGAQKNIGPAGLTLVIVKRELFERMNFAKCPSIFNYQQQDAKGSMINTPATYSWYLASLVFEWLWKQGGVAAMEELAIKKSKLLYQCIDEDDFYRNPVAVKDRSRMNIPFILKDDSLNQLFLSQAKKAQLVGLKGHRSVGGMRASLYNAMPLEGVQALTDFMRDFKQSYG